MQFCAFKHLKTEIQHKEAYLKKKTMNSGNASLYIHIIILHYSQCMSPVIKSSSLILCG